MGDEPTSRTHQPWSFVGRAFNNRNGKLVPNLFPFASELRKWMLREPSSIFAAAPANLGSANPFARDACWLAWAFAAIIDDFAELLKAPVESTDAWRLDLKRIRLKSEFVLYATRIVEATVKQLLYCTTFREKTYIRATFGKLVSSTCQPCATKGGQRHTIDLLGSLAHAYKMCGQYEMCLSKDLQLLLQIRNSETAHATVGTIQISDTPEQALAVAQNDMDRLSEKLLHAFQHLGELEEHMLGTVSAKAQELNSSR